MQKTLVWLLLGLSVCWVGASATTAGVGLGFDPTGLVFFNALTEVSLAEFLDVRAQVGFATQQVAGLMIACVDLLGHHPFPPVDPYLGGGIGLALTPPPYSTGLILEGLGGVRLIPAEPIALFLQLRYAARWSAGGWDSGPIYEGGIQLRF